MTKNDIIKEATFYVKSDAFDDVKDDFSDNDTVKIVDEADDNSENVDVEGLRKDVQRFMDKLNLSQFEKILDKINTPIKQAELIAAFAERVGVPRNKLNIIVKQIKDIGSEQQNENKITKKSLIENIINEKKEKLSNKYKKVQDLLKNDLFNNSAVIEKLWGSKDATNRSLFRKKLHKLKNDSGSEYEFSEQELDKIISIVNQLTKK